MAVLDEQLMAVLRCPACRSELVHRDRRRVLVCQGCRLEYPVREGIPVMLVEEATRR